VYFRLSLFVLLCSGLGFAASLIGTDVLGLEQSPSNAAIARNGIARQNPAVNAFENKTKFGTTILFEYANANKNDASVGLNSFGVPSIYMVLPLGFLGAFSVDLEQAYFASNRLELIDQALDADVLYISRTGIYELAPSYSLRLPFFLSDFALGASYRVFFGNSYSSIRRGRSNNWNEEDWMARNVQITNIEKGHFESADSWQRHFGGSLHYHKKNIDYFVSYFPSVEMRKSITSMVQFSNTDTLQASTEKKTFKLPKQFASGAHFVFAKEHNLSLVYEQKNWGENSIANIAETETQKTSSYFAEYKKSGTGLHYSSFFKKNDFGISAWYADKYIKDASEFGASVFSDLWLGRRGTLVGIALFGGYRQADDPYWNEPFFGFKLNLTGVGNWGTSARRR
jgi:long-chain fatty acid transport protein